MDRIEKYRKIIQDILTAYAAVPVVNGEIISELIFDVERDRYQIVNVGWDGDRRVHSCVLHLDIIDGRVWVQQTSCKSRRREVIASTYTWSNPIVR